MLHFVSTGDTFPYGYYLTLMSALKTQKWPVHLWLARTPTQGFLEQIRDKITVHTIDWPTYPAFKNYEDWRLIAETSTVLRWKILHEHGGAVLDLDVLLLKDLSELLGDKEAAVALRVPTVESTLFPFSCGVVLAKQGYSIIASINRYVQGRVSYAPHKFCDPPGWADLSTNILGIIALEHLDRIEVLPASMLCPFRGAELAREDIELPEDCRMLDLHASSYPDQWAQVDEQGIETSNTLYARTVRDLLTYEERHPRGV